MRNADIQKLERHFVPTHFILSDWESLKPYFDDLIDREWENENEFHRWLGEWSEVQAVVSEEACWKQIRMTCDTENKALEEDFNQFCLEIEPHLRECNDRLNKKLIVSPFLNSIKDEAFDIFLRSVRKEIDLFRKENTELLAQLNVKAQQYGMITGKMTVEVENKEYTLQQAALFLMQSNRAIREEVYHKVNQRRLQDEISLDTLFDELLQLRHQVALNAGFENYRDYKFKELGRFDYSVSDCEQFHEAIRTSIKPLVEKIYEHKKKQLKLEVLKPYDVDAEPEGQHPLKPFQDGQDLLEKSQQVFSSLNPFFGECLKKMENLNHFDLESRKGKAPGGYNCPLAETGAPFIFMNAAGTADDVVTMMHEGGHALHSFLSHDLKYSAYKEYPMEMAELASMSMELFSMEHWHIFYADHSELQRAKWEELERVLSIFPWIATIDKFQHWLYTHPGHTAEERKVNWLRIHEEFSPCTISWEGLEEYRAMLWQKQLHLFEVPFYYIEYGIAQLGALAMWLQFKENKEATLENYMNALSKGNTQTLPELYRSAGISFDFGKENVERLSRFVERELVGLM